MWTTEELKKLPYTYKEIVEIGYPEIWDLAQRTLQIKVAILHGRSSTLWAHSKMAIHPTTAFGKRPTTPLTRQNRILPD